MEIWIKDNNNDCTGIRIDGYKLWTMEICSDFLLIRNSWTPVVDSSNISSTLILEMLDRSWEIYSFELFFHSKILERMLEVLIQVWRDSTWNSTGSEEW